MAKPKKAPAISAHALEPGPWAVKTKIKKRIDEVQEDDPIGT
jgi:hypothetical protein